MSTQLPSRAAIDAAEPLSFPERPHYAARAVTVHLAYHGVPVELHRADVQVADIEKLVDALVVREGWSAPAQAPTPAPSNSTSKAGGRTAPAYDDAGDAVCPVHNRKLNKRAWGWSCPAKAQLGEAQNDKGFCNIRFEE